MAKTRTKRFASQAALEALVRFGPELSGLKALQRQEQANLTLGIHQAHGTAAGIMGAVDRAVPGVKDIYKTATGPTSSTGTMLSNDILNLPGSQDTLKAAAALTTKANSDALQRQGARTLAELQTRKVSAKQGEQFAVEQAIKSYAANLGQILQRKQDLGREKGAFTASTIQDLAQAAAQQAAKAAEGRANRRNARVVAGVDASGQVIPGSPADKKLQQAAAKAKKDAKSKKTINGVAIQTTEGHREFRNTVSRAQQDVSYLRTHGYGRGEILNMLIKGRESQKITASDGTKVTVPGVKQTPEDAARAAINLAFDKQISRATLNLLHKGGYSIKALGYKYQSGKKKPLTEAQKKLGRTVIGGTLDIVKLLGQLNAG